MSGSAPKKLLKEHNLAHEAASIFLYDSADGRIFFLPATRILYHTHRLSGKGVSAKMFLPGLSTHSAYFNVRTSMTKFSRNSGSAHTYLHADSASPNSATISLRQFQTVALHLLVVSTSPYIHSIVRPLHSSSPSLITNTFRTPLNKIPLSASYIGRYVNS